MRTVKVHDVESSSSSSDIIFVRLGWRRVNVSFYFEIQEKKVIRYFTWHIWKSHIINSSFLFFLFFFLVVFSSSICHCRQDESISISPSIVKKGNEYYIEFFDLIEEEKKDRQTDIGKVLLQVTYIFIFFIASILISQNK